MAKAGVTVSRPDGLRALTEVQRCGFVVVEHRDETRPPSNTIGGLKRHRRAGGGLYDLLRKHCMKCRQFQRKCLRMIIRKLRKICTEN